MHVVVMVASNLSQERAATRAAGITNESEVTRLRELDLKSLRARWRIVFGRHAQDHLPHRLLFRILAYQLQADALGGLDQDSRNILDRLGAVTKGESHKVTQQLKQKDAKLRPGTILTREWNNGVHRVTVLQRGFDWEGRTYNSLSAAASAIAGSRWNGHRFFGLRDKPGSRARK
jgi:hypothetical protein